MNDKIINFYEKVGGSLKLKLPKTWRNHHILNNSMILCIGGTWTGNQTP